MCQTVGGNDVLFYRTVDFKHDDLIKKFKMSDKLYYPLAGGGVARTTTCSLWPS